MKSRILVSMLVIALAAALVGGATMSIFTAEAETNERTYAAGTVKIAAGNQTFHEIDTLKNMAPGDTINGEFVVKNTGSLPLWLQVTAVTKEVEGSENNYLFGGGTPAEVTIDNPAGILESGEEATIYYSVYLPLEADNWYQNAEGILLFKVNAEQLDHNDPSGNVVDYQVADFDIEWGFFGQDGVEFKIVNAINIFGQPVTAENKTVKVTLSGLYGSFERTASVDLIDGSSETVGVTGDLGYGQEVVMVVEIDGVQRTVTGR